jgi:hypothetical protein
MSGPPHDEGPERGLSLWVTLRRAVVGADAADRPPACELVLPAAVDAVAPPIVVHPELRTLASEQLVELAEKTDGAPPGGITVPVDDAVLVSASSQSTIEAGSGRSVLRTGASTSAARSASSG